MSKNILVLCTGNSARSIMMEGLINGLGAGRLQAFSAGSKPVGRVNPFAIEQLSSIGVSVDGASSKSWDVFARHDSQPMDIIMTVCANAAEETCPVWPGQPINVHWGFDDPAAVTGSDAEKRAAFALIFSQIRQKVERLLALPLEQLNHSQWLEALSEIGRAPVEVN